MDSTLRSTVDRKGCYFARAAAEVFFCQSLFGKAKNLSASENTLMSHLSLSKAKIPLDAGHLAPGGADFEPVFVGVNLSTEKISGALSKSPELLLKCWQP